MAPLAADGNRDVLEREGGLKRHRQRELAHLALIDPAPRDDVRDAPQRLVPRDRAPAYDVLHTLLQRKNLHKIHSEGKGLKKISKNAF